MVLNFGSAVVIAVTLTALVAFVPCEVSASDMTSTRERRNINQINMVVLAPVQHPLISYRLALPAVESALQVARMQGLLPGLRVKVSCMCQYDWNFTTFGKVDSDLMAAYHKNEMDVIIGPVYSRYVPVVADLGDIGDKPVISPGGYDSDRDRESSPVLTYVGPTTRSNLAGMFLQILKIYNTNKISLVYEDRSQDFDTRWFCSHEMEQLFVALNQSDIDVSSIDIGSGLNTESLLHQLNADKSVIVLCASRDSLIEIMTAAQDLYFDTRNNIFFNVDLFTSKAQLAYLWYKESDSQAKNKRSLRAFQALQTVTIRKSASMEFKFFSREVKGRAKDLYQDFTREEEVNSFVSAYHDAVMLYALALDEAVGANVPTSDGRGITRLMRNMTFQGISGTIAIDEKGNRQSEYSILGVDPYSSKNRVVAHYYASRRMYEPVQGVFLHRPSESDDLLASEIPPTHCGFNGSSCVLGSDDVRVEVSPANIIRGQGAQLVCSSETITDVLMIALLDNTNTPLVYVRYGDQVTFTRSNISNMEATGNISNSKTGNFLKLTISAPETEDSGEYTCIVYRQLVGGNVKQDRSTVNLTVHEKEELTDAVPKNNSTASTFEKNSPELEAIMDRLAILESIVYSHNLTANDRFCGQTGCESTKDNKGDEDILARVEALEKEHDNVTHRLETLSKNDASATAFHSTFNTNSLAVKTGETLQFPGVLTNKGQGYNPQTGIFTAPMNGIYGFHLTIDNRGPGTAQIALKASEGFFAILTTGNNEGKGQSAASSIINLKSGEQVRVEVIRVQGQVSLRGFGYSTFSGYLIWAS